jgi:rubrerythrin
MTAEGPTLDSFLRHLQTEVEAASDISDKTDRNDRLLQLEASIQEAIIFANRYKELQNQGVDPLLLVDPKVQQERPAPPATKGQSILLGSSTCAACGKLLENDLDFCPSCGATK